VPCQATGAAPYTRCIAACGLGEGTILDLELIQRLAVALAIGLLIGMERGWDDQETHETPRIAGVRTFALIALLGALWQLLGSRFGALVIAVGFLGFAALYVSASWLEARGTGHYGITTEVAAFITFTLGALTMQGDVLLPAGTAVIVTIILSAKPILHRGLERLERRELYAILKLLLISVVMLPALPDRGFGPWQAINPYEMWWIVVLICALSFIGYFAQKLAGARRGIILTSLFGGLVSSTATTVSFSRQARAEPALASLYAVGIIIACTVMFPRILIIVGLIQPQLLRALAWPMGIMAVIACASALGQWRALKTSKEVEAPTLQNPFDFRMALQFAALLTLILILARALRTWFGSLGVYLLAAVAGLSDVDAIAVSLSRTAPEELALVAAAGAITVAALVNTVVKGLMAVFIGGGTIGRRVGLTNAVAAAGGMISLLFMR
jgi:uncharacterized membrane protein (DUF4010 family)